MPLRSEKCYRPHFEKLALSSKRYCIRAVYVEATYFVQTAIYTCR